MSNVSPPRPPPDLADIYGATAPPSVTSPRNSSGALQRAKTLESRYPLSEQCACCRVVMELDLEYTVYEDALEAYLEPQTGLSLDPSLLPYCIKSLTEIILRLEESDSSEVRVKGRKNDTQLSARARRSTSPASEENAVEGDAVPESMEQRALEWPAREPSYYKPSTGLKSFLVHLGLNPRPKGQKSDPLYYLRILLEDLIMLEGSRARRRTYTIVERRREPKHRLESIKAGGKSQARAPSNAPRIENLRRKQKLDLMAKDQMKPVNSGSIFIVVGLFDSDLIEPLEVCLRISSQEKAQFLPILKEQIAILRGWRSLISFKTVDGFGLYKCIPIERAHAPYVTSPAEKAMLRQFFRATMESTQSESFFSTALASKDWAEYVHKNFNKSQSHPFCGELSLQLQLRWSKLRLALAASTTLSLSFIAGMLYTFLREGSDDKVSAAWTLASYIVTSGAFIIALGAVLSGFKD